MLIDKVKRNIGISHNEFDEDIQDLIDAALLELKSNGVTNTKEDDPLIIKAVNVYCKANTEPNKDKAEQFQKSFESLKTFLSLCGDYNVIS